MVVSLGLLRTVLNWDGTLILGRGGTYDLVTKELGKYLFTKDKGKLIEQGTKSGRLKSSVGQKHLNPKYWDLDYFRL